MPNGAFNPASALTTAQLGRWVPGDEIAGEDDQVRLERIGDLHPLSDLAFGHERPDVDVGKLCDAESVKSLRQAASWIR